MTLSVKVCIYKGRNKKSEFMPEKGFGRMTLRFVPIFVRAPCHALWQLAGRILWFPEKFTYSKAPNWIYLFWKTSWDLETKYAAGSICWLAIVIDFWGILDNSLRRSFFSQKARLTDSTKILYYQVLFKRLTVLRWLEHCICIRSLQRRWRTCCSRHRWCFWWEVGGHLVDWRTRISKCLILIRFMKLFLLKTWNFLERWAFFQETRWPQC